MEDFTNTHTEIKNSEDKGKGFFAINLIKTGDLIFDLEENGVFGS